MPGFDALFPNEISVSFALILIAISFVTSAVTGAFGVGGGLMLLAVMATGLPLATVIPVHGVVQCGSNIGRTGLLWRHIQWRLVVLLTMSAAIGAVLGGLFVVAAPDAVLRFGVAAFVVFMVWGPKPLMPGQSDAGMAVGGGVAGLLTMLFGATGPFVAALLSHRDLERRQLSGTFSATMSAHHFVKIGLFVALGFAFAAWIPLMAMMIATGFLGTMVGVRMLTSFSERFFRLAFRIVLTVLAINLAATAVIRLLG